jgi:HK97 family phage major capsid protein
MTLTELLANLRAQHDRAISKRDAAVAEARTVAEAAGKAGRSELTAEEDSRVSELMAARDAASGEAETLGKRVASVAAAVADEDKRAEGEARTEETGHKAPVARAHVTDPEMFRRNAPANQSYFRHLYRATQLGNRESADMLSRHDKAMADSAEYRALTTVDGAGGEFVPPLWLMQDFLALARAGRVTVDQLRQEQMPAGTDTISLPRLATGTAVAEQATQNTAVQNTDATTSSISAAVATIAGQQVVSQQLLDQSPVNMDSILLADLAADYAIKADVFALNNNATNKVGLLNVSGINAVTYTSGTPTVGALYSKTADAIQQINTGRFLPGDKIIMHPRRWAWFLAAVDSTGRPLVTPDAMNSIAQGNGVTSAQGRVGVLQGLPVFIDPNIPINLGAGTNEDRIIILRSSDSIWFESAPKSETFRETYANQLSVLLRFYAYVAIHASRYPKSISVISGTGLVTPVF